MRKLLLLLLPLALALGGCSRQPVKCQDFILNTYVSVTIFQGGGEQEAQDALDACRAYEKIFSRTDPASELYRLNHRELSEVSPELREVIEEGLRISALSQGAFDITAGSLTQLWDFHAEAPQLPDPVQLAEAQTHVGWEKVHVEGSQVIFDDPETILDLGGIAKGYIADRLSQLLREEGVTSAIVDLGGDLYCLGSKPDGSDFSVGVQHPDREHRQVIGGVRVHDRSVVTSGVYERCFFQDGRRYHHILDTETGWPVENGLLSVTILSDSSELGDALSTAAFALGPEKGMEWIESLPDTEALLIDENLEVHLSSGMKEIFTPIEEK